MTGATGTRWTPEEIETQNDAIAAVILSGGTWADAAERAGVSRRTVGRRLEDPELRRRIAHERAAVLHLAAEELGDLVGHAVAVYRDVLTDDQATTGEKLRAADGVLAGVRSFIGDAEMADRFTALEERLSDAEALARGELIETTATEVTP